ncbi:ABC transporter ATP-binding protein [Stappia sp.]|uniref:ABC transporter ATP-binding protein n=1 Tax=Stappia sp. TaxID=1870903 RepID=UPI0025D52B76|nr:dipeptide ABC transporter ATP-binding protein [Stappia sp.]
MSVTDAVSATGDTPDVVLEARGLAKHFRAGSKMGGSLLGEQPVVRAVDGVSLSVRRGETLAVVGESGCGKSTLARLLLRLIDPTAGEVFYGGRDIARLPAAEMRRLRRDLQFVFQDPFSSLNPRMTVGAIVEEPMRVHGTVPARERRTEVQKLLARVGIRPAYASRYPHEFSGGQRQRIGIARALASGPRVLIGDEPVSALDVSVQAQVINLLEDLKDEFDLTLVLIAHDLAVIRHMSDRVAVMYLGEVVELAGTDELYARPLHPYTRVLMRAIPIPSPRARKAEARLTGDVPSPLNPPAGCRFHTRCPLASEICAIERPVLSEVEPGRQVACHHWQSVESDAEALEPEPSPAARRRLVLYRARSTAPKSGAESPKSGKQSSSPEEI